MAGRTTTKAATSVEAIARRIPETAREVPGSREQIARVVATIAARFDPARIILFGSRAYGRPTSESDVDLMVVMETAARGRERADALSASIEPKMPFSVDLHVRTPTQIRLGLREHDFFILDVMNGITLYEGTGGDLTPHDEHGETPTPSGLKHATQEWLDKANENYRVAAFILDTDLAAFDAVCFHAQQSVERMLKALLQEREIRTPRTHDLVDLAQACLHIVPALEALESDLECLSKCAVDPRYPGLDIKPAEAEQSVRIMKAARAAILPALGLPAE